MNNFLTRLTVPIILGTVGVFSSVAEALPLIQKDLFFKRQTAQEQFEKFVDRVIAPRFPNGLTVFEAKTTKGTFMAIVTLFIEETSPNQTSINEIVAEYLKEFKQENVLQVTNRDDLKVGFGVGEDLIDNDPIPEWIQVELFFGRNILGGGEVTEEQFQAFLDRAITPRFPDNVTIVNAQGQFKNRSGIIIREATKVVTLLLEDTIANEKAIDEIIATYLQQFQQESVLIVVDEDVEIMP